VNGHKARDWENKVNRETENREMAFPALIAIGLGHLKQDYFKLRNKND
jgi:hypothetical protein